MSFASSSVDENRRAARRIAPWFARNKLRRSTGSIPPAPCPARDLYRRPAGSRQSERRRHARARAPALRARHRRAARPLFDAIQALSARIVARLVRRRALERRVQLAAGVEQARTHRRGGDLQSLRRLVRRELLELDEDEDGA